MDKRIRLFRNRPFAAALLTGCAFVLSGCIHFDHRKLDALPLEPVRTLDQQPCCDSLIGQPALQLPHNEYVSVTIDRTDPVLLFPSGESFARIVRLPDLDGEFLLQLDSVVYRPDIDLHPKALYPMVALLDDQLNTIAVYDNEPVDLQQPILGPELVRIVLTIPDSSPAQYAVLYTSRDKTELGLTTKSPIEIVQKDNFDTIIYTRPTETRFKIQFETTGMINVLAWQDH